MTQTTDAALVERMKRLVAPKDWPEVEGLLVAQARRIEALDRFRNRKGGVGPHLDKTEATPSQLADWAEQAATNLERGWLHPDMFTAFLGGWEHSFLRHLAKEMRALAEATP